jgi:dTMP kinase
MATTTSGVLIAVEGLDGSGKSTQAHLLVRWLEALQLPVHATQWNSSPLVSSATREGKATHRLVPSTFHYIHAADFADRYERQIEPMLAAEGIVVADRYLYTAMARDGARGVPLDHVERVYAFAREPDLTLFFDAPPEITLERILKGRPELKYYEAGLDMGWTFDPYESFRIMQGKMYAIYAQLADAGRMTRISAVATVAEVQEAVRRVVTESIDLGAIHRLDPLDRFATEWRWRPSFLKDGS